MKKRILALLLVVTMVMSLLACGNNTKKAPSLTDSVQNASKITKGISDIEITMSMEGLEGVAGTEYAELLSNMSLKMTVVLESVSPSKASVELSYKLGTATEYKKLTTIIVNDKELYINLKEVKTAVSDIATVVGQSQALALLAFLPTQEYLKVTEEELNTYAGTLTGVNSSVTSGMDEASQAAGLVISKHLCKFVEEVTKDVKPAVISGETDNITLTVTKENLNPIIDALSLCDVGSYYDALVKDLEAVSGTEEIVSSLKESKEEAIKSFKAGLVEMKTSLNKDKTLTDLNVVFNLANSGKEGKRVVKQNISFKFAAEDGKGNVGVNAVTKEEIPADKTITLPTDCISLTDFVSSIMSMFSY